MGFHIWPENSVMGQWEREQRLQAEADRRRTENTAAYINRMQAKPQERVSITQPGRHKHEWQKPSETRVKKRQRRSLLRVLMRAVRALAGRKD